MIIDFTDYRITGLAHDAQEARAYAVQNGDMYYLDIVVSEIKRYEAWLKTHHPLLWEEKFESNSIN